MARRPSESLSKTWKEVARAFLVEEERASKRTNSEKEMRVSSVGNSSRKVSRASAGPSSLSGGIMEAMKSRRVMNLTPLRSALAYLVNSFSSSASGFYK